MRSPAATPLWNSGHSVKSVGAELVSRRMIEFVGGRRPESESGGIGSGSAIKGSKDDNVNRPRPTEAANDLCK